MLHNLQRCYTICKYLACSGKRWCFRAVIESVQIKHHLSWLSRASGSSDNSSPTNLWQRFFFLSPKSVFLQVWRSWVMRTLHHSYLPLRVTARDFSPHSLDLLLFHLAAILCTSVTDTWSSCKQKYMQRTPRGDTKQPPHQRREKLPCWQRLQPRLGQFQIEDTDKYDLFRQN